MAVKDWSPEEQAEAKDAAVKRQGMTRPLRMGDLSRREKTEAMGLLNEKNVNIKQRIQKRIAGAKTPAPADIAAVNSPELKPRNNSIRQMSNALVKRTESAASGPHRLEGESIAGTGFYFDQRRPLAEVTDDVHTLALASSRLSPKTKPSSEAKTAVALAKAHNEQGTVTFAPKLVKALGGNVRQEHVGKTVNFSDVDSKVVSLMRKDRHRDVAYDNSKGVDWDSMRSVGLDANVERAHKVLQGNPEATPDIYKNPKQTGYARSISEATPGPVEEEYKFRAAHLGSVIRGETHPGQTALDTGLLHSNEGMLSNEAPIAGDTWTRRATSGQHLDVAGPVADTFISSKGDVGAGDVRVQPVGIEHAAQQAAVEGAAKTLQRKHQTEFTVPSRLLQETGGWAEPRRAAGGDAEYNAVRRDQESAANNRNVNQRQHQGQGALF